MADQHPPRDDRDPRLTGLCASDSLELRGREDAPREIVRGRVPLQESTSRSADICNCGHPLAEHAESGWGPNSVCVHKLPTWPDGGWYGVCPCVRTDDLEEGS